MSFDDWHKELISDYQWYSLLRMYKEETIKKASDELKSIKNQLWKPDPLCPNCKGSGGVQTGENEYSTCPCVKPKK